MKSFRDYLSLKEVSAVALGRELVGTKVSLTPDETNAINDVLDTVEEILAGPKASSFLQMLEKFSDTTVNFDLPFLRRAAKKLIDAKSDQRGLGSMDGSEDEIATSSADRTTSNF